MTLVLTHAAFAVVGIYDVASETAANVTLCEILAEMFTSSNGSVAEGVHRRTELIII